MFTCALIFIHEAEFKWIDGTIFRFSHSTNMFVVFNIVISNFKFRLYEINKAVRNTTFLAFQLG